MVGTLAPTGPRTPERGTKDSHRQEEENAHHLQTHNAADTAERAQKSAHAARHALGRLSRRASVHTGSAHCSSFASPSARGHALTGHSPGNPQPDAQDAPDVLRSHSVMMVAAAVTEPLFSARLRFPVDPERQQK